jgi:hypothetical protein
VLNIVVLFDTLARALADGASYDDDVSANETRADAKSMSNASHAMAPIAKSMRERFAAFLRDASRRAALLNKV